MTVDAVMAPDQEQRSIRADQLQQDTLDVMAWAFREGASVSGFPVNTIEIRIGGDEVGRLLFNDGPDQLHVHALSNSLRYMKRAGDEGWAVVFDHDCPGDPDRGRKIVSEREES